MSQPVDGRTECEFLSFEYHENEANVLSLFLEKLTSKIV